MTVLSRLVQKRAAIVGSWQSMDPAAIPPNSASFSYAAGVVVNDQTALTLAAVFRAISIVSESVAQMDWASYRGVGTERKPVPNQPNVVLDPFVGVRRREGIAQIMVSLLLRGNAYLLITQRDPTLGWPLKVKIVHPDAITVRSANGVIQYFTGTNTQIPTENIVHIRGLTLPGMEVGVSPIDLAAQSFAVGIAAREFGSRFFAQGVNPSGVIETTDPIDEDEARRIAQRIQKAHGGSSNSHLPLILDAGMSWKTITLTPDQAQFLQTQDHSRSEVATWFGVPPHLLQDVSKTTSWGCLPGDSMVFTTHGPVPIEDIKVGEEVWSLRDKHLEPSKVTAWKMTGYRKTLRFDTQSRTLRATDNHWVPIRRHYGYAEGASKGECGWQTLWVQAAQIKVGDYLLIPSGLPAADRRTAPNGRALTVQAMELCGFYTGNGNTDGNRIELAHASGADCMNYYREAISTEFGVRPYVDEGRPTRTRFSSVDALDLLSTGFRGYALTKRVPEWVFRLTPELQLGFLRGYLDSDGSVQRGRIMYTSAHKKLLEDVRHLCIGLGIPVGRVCKGRDSGPMTIEGRTYMSQVKWQLSLSDLPSNSRIGSNSPRKVSRFATAGHQRRLRNDPEWVGNNGVGNDWDVEGVQLQRVNSITEDPLEIPVYDISVEGSETFVADGVLVHNSGIEDQMIQYVTFTIRGWAQRIEEAWDTELLPRGNYARFDFESLLRANTLVRAQYYMMMRTIGALSVNDVRAMEDQPPVDGGDSYTQPMNAPTPQPTLSLAPAEGAKDDSKG